MTVRLPAVAGAFYPGGADPLRRMIAGFRPGAAPKAEHGIIVPHAGYVYSGKTAAHAFAPFAKTSYEIIILLGPSHHVGFRGVALDTNDVWSTPLGEARIDYSLLKTLVKEEPLFLTTEEPHQEEHALEVQVPFLQYHAIEGPLAPLVVGQLTDADATKIAEVLARLLENRKVLLVVSTDLSHYLSRAVGGKRDAASIAIIEKLDLATFSDLDACGKYPLRIILHLCKQMGWAPKLVHRSDSGDETGDTNQVVGYASFVF